MVMVCDTDLTDWLLLPPIEEYMIAFGYLDIFNRML
jgi:hypothetical protein